MIKYSPMRRLLRLVTIFKVLVIFKLVGRVKNKLKHSKVRFIPVNIS